MAFPMLGGGGLMMNPLSTSMSWSSMKPNSHCWLLPQMSHSHICLMLDNTTAAAYIDKMGGLHSPSCNEIALSIWHWAKDRNVWLSTAFIQGVENTVADFHSRNFRDNTEWMLLTLWCSNSFLPFLCSRG